MTRTEILETVQRIERRESERRATARVDSGRRYYERLAAEAHYVRQAELAEGYLQLEALAAEIAASAIMGSAS